MEPSLIREISWNAFLSVNHHMPKAGLGIKNFNPNPLLVFFFLTFDKNPQKNFFLKIILVSNRDDLEGLQLRDVLTGHESPHETQHASIRRALKKHVLILPSLPEIHVHLALSSVSNI